VSDITSSILGSIDETRPAQKAFTAAGPYPFSPVMLNAAWIAAHEKARSIIGRAF
jgi:hypothetical protein